jgi:hypothetical protein
VKVKKKKKKNRKQKNGRERPGQGTNSQQTSSCNQIPLPPTPRTILVFAAVCVRVRVLRSNLANWRKVRNRRFWKIPSRPDESASDGVEGTLCTLPDCTTCGSDNDGARRGTKTA